MLEKIIEFISIAQKNRKYASNTASGFKSALKLFEPQLNDQEREDISVFKNNLDKICQEVYAVNKSKFSAATINEYKRRLAKLLADYESYGIDPSKMASWNPVTRIRTSSPAIKNEKRNGVDEGQENTDDISKIITTLAMDRYEITLRPNVKAIVVTPSDISTDEIKKIKAYVDMLEVLSGGK